MTAADSEMPTRSYEADIRWTTHGVAHIHAVTWGDLGFGQGYACARDNLATLADMFVKVRSERARFHGTGPDGANVASDFGYLALDITARAAALRDAQTPRVRELIAGYTAGYNAWLDEALATGALPGWCAEAEWLTHADEMDVWRYVLDVSLLASGRNLVGLIGRAEAPGPDGPCPPSPLSALGAAAGAASNGWAFGSEGTASGSGLVMANPHFPWHGEARFWECHLTIPDELDVYGVCLVGVPGVQIGFNRHVGWTHTFSRGNRMTIYRLDLAEGDPTSYRFGDETRSMSPREHQVMVRGDDGELTPVTRTLWSSHHGPMLNMPLLGWGNEIGFTYRDANLANTTMVEQFVRMNTATSLDEFKAAFTEAKGMPWANTLAADTAGEAWYCDASATPNISAAAQQRFRGRVETDLVASLLAQNRVALLDGSEPDDSWLDEPGARSPGLIPHERLPELSRRDYVVNANDSHWLSHGDAPLEGYSVLHGFERTPRSLRTRHNIRLAQRLATEGATVESALETLLESTSLNAELLRAAVADRLRTAAPVDVDGTLVDVERAAHILDGWDGTFGCDSVGAVLWRETMAAFSDAEMLDAGPLFAEPFDPDDPVSTPRGLADPIAAGVDQVVVAVAKAIVALGGAGVAIDARLGDVQWAPRGPGGEHVGVPGGGELDGVANVLAPKGALPSHSLVPTPPPLPQRPGRTERTGLHEGGYPVTYGVSFLMAVEMLPGGPRAKGLLAYGQHDDWAHPGNLEATRALGAGAFRPLLFDDTDIETDPNLVRQTVRTRR